MPQAIIDRCKGEDGASERDARLSGKVMRAPQNAFVDDDIGKPQGIIFARLDSVAASEDVPAARLVMMLQQPSGEARWLMITAPC